MGFKLAEREALPRFILATRHNSRGLMQATILGLNKSRMNPDAELRQKETASE
jgi:hypothetical protein